MLLRRLAWILLVLLILLVLQWLLLVLVLLLEGAPTTKVPLRLRERSWGLLILLILLMVLVVLQGRLCVIRLLHLLRVVSCLISNLVLLLLLLVISIVRGWCGRVLSRGRRRVAWGVSLSTVRLLALSRIFMLAVLHLRLWCCKLLRSLLKCVSL